MSILRVLAASLFFVCLSVHAEPANPKIVERYKQMLAANPVEGTALDRLWKIHLDQGQANQLIEEYQAGETFVSEMVLGHLLRKAARTDEASAAFLRAAQLDAKSPLPWLVLARLNVDQGKQREAAKAFEKAAAALPEKDPQQAEVLMQLGAAWLASGDASKAAESWERAIAVAPENLDLRRRLAEACAANQLPDRAITHLEYLEKNGPPQERARALQQLARIHQGAGQQDEAIAALERALSYTAPGNWLRAELQSQIIRLHQRYHRTVELEERWAKNVQDNPRDVAAYLQLIDLYERTGELEKQRAWLEKLIALAPKTAEYREKLARLLVQIDRLDQALPLFDQLLSEQPGNVDILFERARLDVQRDATEAARARIAALLKAKKNDEAVRSRALEFYESHRLYDLVEEHLKADAAGDAEEPLLALANFLFRQHRETEARAVLERLIPANASQEQQAAALFKQSQILKSQNEFATAASVLRKAIALAAEPREMWSLLGEIESARANLADARLAFEKAVELSRTPREQMDADQKLFESIRAEPEPEPADPVKRATARSVIPSTRESSAAVQAYLLAIMRSVSARPTVEGWLRVARWHFWSHNLRPAKEYAQKALAVDPVSVSAHEFMVKITSAEPAVALTHLRELMRLDPARKAEYERRTGQIELQAGHLDEATRIFAQLVKDNPGSPDALTDLALAQQRSEDWEKALATWREVYAVSPAARKKEVIGPLLRVYERLNQHQQAAELLLKQIDGQGDEKEQFATFQELLNLCAKHELVGWLREEMEKRRKLRVDDYFTEMALGRILKLTGNKAAAFEVLADASFAAPNPAEALPELVREAEELRKLDAAIRLQAQLVRIVPQKGPEAVVKLAQLQEKNFDLKAAAQSWERIVAKFPRDAASLEKAVEFQLRWGSPDRAAQLLRKVRALDPANLRALAQLAQLDIEAGETAEARQCLEHILARSTPERPGEPLRIPGVKSEDRGRLQTTYRTTVLGRRGREAAEVIRALRQFWVEDEKPGRSDREVRLSAIRDLGKLLQINNDPAALTAWIERWRAARETPTETLWALYFAGASGPLLDHVERLLAASPNDPQLKQSFIWLALQTGEFERLSAWLQDRRRTPAERDYFQIAFGQHLQARPGKVDAGLVEKLFPPGYKLRVWQAAALFGTYGCFREATQLGERVFAALSSQRAAYGLELAHWYLYLGDVEKARQLLRDSLATPGESYDAPFYAALREYWLLLPEAERETFAESFALETGRLHQPLHATLVRALLAGLAGKEEKARTQLRRLLELGVMSHVDPEELGTSASRYWDFVLNTGAELQTWKLDRLAAYLWDTALADEALIQLHIRLDVRPEIQVQGDQIQNSIRKIRARLAALQLLRAGRLEADAILEKYQRQADAEGLSRVAEALETLGAYAQAILVSRTVWEREPANPHALRDLLATCRASNDFETLEEVLGRCVQEGLFRTNEAAHRDLTVQLVDSFDRRGAYSQARMVLGEAIEQTPADARLLERLGRLHERASRLSEAETVFRRWLQLEPANTPARVALAGVLQAQGNVPAAIELLEKSSGLEVDTKLVDLYVAANRSDDAIAAIERIMAPNHLSVALLLADGLAKKDERRGARSVLRRAIARSADTRAIFPLQSKMIELLDPQEDELGAAREARRMRQMAGDQPDLLSAYFDLMVREAARLKRSPEFARELAEDWDEGNGLAAAGVALLEWELKTGNPAAADATWARLLARDDLSEALWVKTVALLEKAQRPELAVQAHARLARQAPLNHARMFDWARALLGLERTADARLVLDELAQRTVLNDDIAGQTAKFFAEMQEPARARALFAKAVAADPAARNYRVFLDYAKLLHNQGDVAGARQQLRAAFRNPANREFNELIAFLIATGRLAQFDGEIAGFELRPQVLLSARRALFAHFEKAQDATGAIAVLDEHPEIMEAGLGARLRALAGAAKAFAKVAAVLERIVAQAPLESVETAGELAALYGDWAESELNALQEDAALAHLQRGHELKQDLFPVMQRLAELLIERDDPVGAARVVQDFLTSSKDPEEKEKARQILVRIDR